VLPHVLTVTVTVTVPVPVPVPVPVTVTVTVTVTIYWRGGRGRAGRLGPEGGGSADDREGGRGGACVTACIKRKFLQSGLVFLFVLLLVYIYNKED
jgi:hypothetical protein